MDEMQQKNFKEKLQRNHLLLSHKTKKTDKVSENGERDCEYLFINTNQCDLFIVFSK